MLNYFYIILNLFNQEMPHWDLKNLLYKSVLAKTAAVARHTKFQTI